MGTLDDAIREHLELKKRSGASEEEVKRLESEAFGPVRREAAATAAPDPPQPVAPGRGEGPAPAPPAAPQPAAGDPEPPTTVIAREPERGEPDPPVEADA